MPSLKEAYLGGLNMRRKPAGLSVVYRTGVDGDYCPFFESDVSGGSQDYHCEILDKGGEHLYHCDCPDFQFTFWPYLAEKGEQIGEFPVIEPSGKGYPRAISDYGMCKHLLATVDKLILDGHIGAMETSHGRSMVQPTGS